MARKTLREISRLFAAEKLINPATVATLEMTTVGTDKALKFVASVTIAGVEYEVASDSGKIKSFTDVDGFLKFAAKAAEKGDGVYQVSIDTGSILASKVPNDMKAAAGSQILTLGKTKVNQTAVIADIDDALALMVGWEAGNQAQQAKKTETQAQRAAVVTDVAAIDAEVIRLTAIVNSNS